MNMKESKISQAFQAFMSEVPQHAQVWAAMVRGVKRQLVLGNLFGGHTGTVTQMDVFIQG